MCEMEKDRNIAFGFTLKEVILLGSMIATIVGTAAVNFYRIDVLDDALVQHINNDAKVQQTLAKRISDSEEGLIAHIQWELQHELEQKQKEIDQLKNNKN